MIKHLILNRWTGVNLRYSVEEIAAFISKYQPSLSQTEEQICKCIRDVFKAAHTTGNFVLIALNEKDKMVGVLVISSGDIENNEYTIPYFVTNFRRKKKKHQQEILHFALKCCVGNLWLPLKNSTIETGVFEQLGFLHKDSYMYLERN